MANCLYKKHCHVCAVIRFISFLIISMWWLSICWIHYYCCRTKFVSFQFDSIRLIGIWQPVRLHWIVEAEKLLFQSWFFFSEPFPGRMFFFILLKNRKKKWNQTFQITREWYKSKTINQIVATTHLSVIFLWFSPWN